MVLSIIPGSVNSSRFSMSAHVFVIVSLLFNSFFSCIDDLGERAQNVSGVNFPATWVVFLVVVSSDNEHLYNTQSTKPTKSISIQQKSHLNSSLDRIVRP